MSKGKDLDVNINFLFYTKECQLSFANFEYTCLEKCEFEMYEVFVFYTRGGKSCGYRSEVSLFTGDRVVMDSRTLHTHTRSRISMLYSLLPFVIPNSLLCVNYPSEILIS